MGGVAATMTQPPQNPGGEPWGQQPPGPPPAYGTPSGAAGSYPPASPAPGPGSGGGGKGRMWAIIGCVGCGVLALIVVIVLVAVFALRDGGDDPTPSPTTDDTVTTEPETTEPETTEPETTEPETTEPETTAAETTAATGDVTAEDESAAKTRFIEFLTALGDEDYTTACSYMVNPTTKEPFSSGEQSACADGMTSSASSEDVESIKLLATIITEDDITSTVGDDGIITLDVYGSDFQMIRAGDSLWYVYWTM